MQNLEKYFSELNNLAIKAAKSAGIIVSAYTGVDLNVNKKNEKGGDALASQVVTKVDTLAQEAILEILEPTFEQYELGLLTEEKDDDGSRFEKDYFWCIDPLDGTLSFINNTPGYSISIALVAKDGTPVIGVVFDPRSNILYSAIKGNGAKKNEMTWEIEKENNELFFVTDDSFKESLMYEEAIVKLNVICSEKGYAGLKIIVYGGAVLNVIKALEQAPGCFFKTPKPTKGCGCSWDYAATICICNELNTPPCDFFGDSINLNAQGETFMNKKGVLFASDQQLLMSILQKYKI